MTPTRDAYLVAAQSAAQLLDAPAVEATWDAPSALAEFSVSGLAGHLAGQVLNVQAVLAQPPTQEQPISLLDHYHQAQWIDAALDDEISVNIRQGGDRTAAGGAADLAARVASVVADLKAALAAEPADRQVFLPWTGWSLTLDDFLVTRMMEIAVHSDDLAVSVGVAAAELPPPVLDPVLALLSQLAVRRHGQAAVLRALSRAERAPDSITAF
jgi:hypothetical protein